MTITKLLYTVAMFKTLGRPIAIILLVTLLLYFIYEVLTVNGYIAKTLNEPTAEYTIPPNYQSIYNLPHVNVELDPPTLNQTSCTTPLKVSDGTSCYDACGMNTSAIELNITADDTYIAGSALPPGRYCTTIEPEECSSLWGYSILGANSWECVSKYPDVIGGRASLVPNYSFYDTNTFLAKNVIVDAQGMPVDTTNTFIDFANERDGYSLQCLDKVDGFDMVQLPGTFKCVKDPCQSIPGTDSKWNPALGICECGTNQTHLDPSDDTSLCIGSNYVSEGYDEKTTTQTDRIACDTTTSPYTGQLVIPCPNVVQQVSTYGAMTYKMAKSSNAIIPYASGWTLAA